MRGVTMLLLALGLVGCGRPTGEHVDAGMNKTAFVCEDVYGCGTEARLGAMTTKRCPEPGSEPTTCDDLDDIDFQCPEGAPLRCVPSCRVTDEECEEDEPPRARAFFCSQIECGDVGGSSATVAVQAPTVSEALRLACAGCGTSCSVTCETD